MDILKQREREDLVYALDILKNPRFEKYVVPILEDRISWWKDKIASEDENDIERRGIVKGISWLIGLKSLIESAISSNSKN